MTDTTQPKPGRELDVLMARVMGWAVYEEVDWMRDIPPIPDYPYIVKGVSDGPCWIVRSKQDSGTLPYWQPSTNLLHAFEVDHEGWQWNTIESEVGVCGFTNGG